MTSQYEAGNERNGGVKEDKKFTQEQNVELSLNFDLGPRFRTQEDLSFAIGVSAEHKLVPRTVPTVSWDT